MRFVYQSVAIPSKYFCTHKVMVAETRSVDGKINVFKKTVDSKLFTQRWWDLYKIVKNEYPNLSHKELWDLTVLRYNSSSKEKQGRSEQRQQNLTNKNELRKELLPLLLMTRVHPYRLFCEKYVVDANAKRREYNERVNSLTEEEKAYLKELSKEKKLKKVEKIAKSNRRHQLRELAEIHCRPNRPLNAYLRFKKTVLGTVPADCSFDQKRTSAVADLWNSLPADEKQKLTEEHRADWDKYKSALKLWEEEMIVAGYKDIVRKFHKQKLADYVPLGIDIPSQWQQDKKPEEARAELLKKMLRQRRLNAAKQLEIHRRQLRLLQKETVLRRNAQQLEEKAASLMTQGELIEKRAVIVEQHVQVENDVKLTKPSSERITKTSLRGKQKKLITNAKLPATKTVRVRETIKKPGKRSAVKAVAKEQQRESRERVIKTSSREKQKLPTTAKIPAKTVKKPDKRSTVKAVAKEKQRKLSTTTKLRTSSKRT